MEGELDLIEVTPINNTINSASFKKGKESEEVLLNNIDNFINQYQFEQAFGKPKLEDCSM